MSKIIADISTFNTIADYKLFTKSVDGVIIRIGYSGYKNGTIEMDAKFLHHIQNFLAVKPTMPFGVYFTSQAINTTEAEHEAEVVINIFRKHNIPVAKLGIFLDLEPSPAGTVGRANHIGYDARTQVALAFCKRINLYSYGKCGIYASKYWLEHKFDINRIIYEVPSCTIWVAQYNNVLTYNGTAHLWQYTSRGRIQGAKGDIDLSEYVVNKNNNAKKKEKKVYMVSFADVDNLETARIYADMFETRLGTKSAIIHSAKISDISTHAK